MVTARNMLTSSRAETPCSGSSAQTRGPLMWDGDVSVITSVLTPKGISFHFAWWSLSWKSCARRAYTEQKTPDSTDCRYVSTAGGDPRNPSWGSNTTIAASSSPALEARSSVQPRLERTMTHIQVYKSSGLQKSEGKSFKVADWRKHSAQLGRGQQLPVPPNFLLDCEVAPSCIYPCEGGNDPGNCARGWSEQVFKSADTEWIWSSAGHLWNTCDTD